MHLQEEEKANEVTRIYEQLKVDLKKQTDYQHELELEIAFLTKQCTIANKRSQFLT